MNFEEVLPLARDGGDKIARQNWDAQGYYLDIDMNRTNQIMFYAPNKTPVRWLPTQTEILATDWLVFNV